MLVLQVAGLGQVVRSGDTPPFVGTASALEFLTVVTKPRLVVTDALEVSAVELR